MEERKYEIIKLYDGAWSIEDGFVRCFLVKGDEKALLIDSGIDFDSIKKLAETILNGPKGAGSWDEIDVDTSVIYTQADVDETDGSFPLELLNTHGDGDHCHGNHEFDWFYLHEADAYLFKREHKDLYEGADGPEIRYVNDGDIIDLGNHPLEIIHIPGHTHGSIAVLDVNARALYPGDSVQNGDIFMFGDHRNLDEYPASLMKLQDMEERFDILYASHAQLKMDPDYIGECFDACESMMHGEVKPREEERHGFKIHAYDCRACTFLVDPDRVFEADEEDE